MKGLLAHFTDSFLFDLQRVMSASIIKGEVRIAHQFWYTNIKTWALSQVANMLTIKGIFVFHFFIRVSPDFFNLENCRNFRQQFREIASWMVFWGLLSIRSIVPPMIFFERWNHIFFLEGLASSLRSSASPSSNSAQPPQVQNLNHRVWLRQPVHLVGVCRVWG